jgi:hypothetical protein
MRLAAPPLNRTAPLDGLLFLQEARTPKPKFRPSPLPEREVFCRLVRYGFGGLPCPGAWKYQFESYATLSAGVKGAALAAPDGLHRMRKALSQLERSLQAWHCGCPAKCG